MKKSNLKVWKARVPVLNGVITQKNGNDMFSVCLGAKQNVLEKAL